MLVSYPVLLHHALKRQQRSMLTTIYVVLAVFWLSIVGGRVYCGMHTIMDIAAGSALGGLLSGGAIFWESEIERWLASVGWHGTFISPRRRFLLIDVGPSDLTPTFSVPILVASTSTSKLVSSAYSTPFSSQLIDQCISLSFPASLPPRDQPTFDAHPLSMLRGRHRVSLGRRWLPSRPLVAPRFGCAFARGARTTICLRVWSRLDPLGLVVGDVHRLVSGQVHFWSVFLRSSPSLCSSGSAVRPY